MEKSINIIIEEFRKNFFKLVNNSGLPISFVYYLFKDFMNELTEIYKETLDKELEIYKNSQEEKIKKKEEIKQQPQPPKEKSNSKKKEEIT